jgi:hypothetical protein
MRGGQVWSEGQVIGERAVEPSREGRVVDEVPPGVAEESARVSDALTGDVLAQGGAYGESVVGDAASVARFRPILAALPTTNAGPPVDDTAQDVLADLPHSPEQVRPQTAEEETDRFLIGLKVALALGWLAGVALSPAALGSRVLWRRAERRTPPFQGHPPGGAGAGEAPGGGGEEKGTTS